MLDVFAARPWREAEGRILLFGVVVDGWRGGRCGAMVGKVMQLDEGDAPLDEGADADGAGEDSDGGEVERKRPRLSEEHRAQLERDIFGSGSESDS